MFFVFPLFTPNVVMEEGIIVQGIDYCSVRVLFSEGIVLGASGLFFCLCIANN